MKRSHSSEEILKAVSNRQSVNKALVLNLLQDELHWILESILNGGFSKKGYLIYPLVKDVSKEIITRGKRLNLIVGYLQQYYDFSKSAILLKRLKSKKADEILTVLAAIYEEFGGIKKIGARGVNKEECEKFDVRSYGEDREYVKPIEDLKDFGIKKLSKYASGFYLHGSFATRDYIKGWSDVDVLLVLKKGLNAKDLLKLRDLLYKSRSFFYEIDPLQHHGYMIATEYDLESYCQNYLPLFFRYFKSFIDEIGKVSIRKSEVEAKDRLNKFVDYFISKNEEKKYRGIYEAKLFLHMVTLFPSIYLQTKGVYVYKKFSFDIAKKDFSAGAWQPIETATKIRATWRAVKAPVRFGFNPLLSSQINAKYWDITKGLEKKNDLIPQYLKLINGVQDLVKETGC